MTDHKLVILDRDGVINEDSDAYVKSVGEWIPLEGSINAIARMSRAGYHICVATNQSGVARGLLTENELKEMHHRLCSLVEAKGGVVDGVFYCPHGPDEGCRCRKPAPGLLLEIGKTFGIPLHDVPVVGDSERDLLAALKVGCQPVLVKTGNGEQTLLTADPTVLSRTRVFADLATFADSLLAGDTQ